MGMGIYGSKQKSDRIMKLLMGGEANTDFLGVSSLTQMSRQKCKNLFISMSFKEKSLTWKNTAVNEWNHIGIGPSYYPTDFGACCLFCLIWILKHLMSLVRSTHLAILIVEATLH